MYIVLACTCSIVFATSSQTDDILAPIHSLSPIIHKISLCCSRWDIQVSRCIKHAQHKTIHRLHRIDLHYRHTLRMRGASSWKCSKLCECDYITPTSVSKATIRDGKMEIRLKSMSLAYIYSLAPVNIIVQCSIYIEW